MFFFFPLVLLAAFLSITVCVYCSPQLKKLTSLTELSWTVDLQYTEAIASIE